jgi:hypothetical protein
MPANLTPQYLEAEADFRRAQTAEERLECLQRMWRELPKHKGTDKLQAELKSKISEAKKEVEHERRSPKKGAGVSYKFPHQGAGQYVLIGAPNTGKSRLLTRLTRATPEVAAYPFTTREPHAGMMEFEDVRVQLIDTPPITPDFLEPYIGSLIRGADRVLLMVDLADDDGPFAAEAVIEKLASVKTVLAGQPPAAPEDLSIHFAPTLMGANKIDADGAEDRLAIVREMFAERFPIVVFSAEHGQGIEELKQHLYGDLKVIRVYTKMPGKPPDMLSPFTIPVGGTVLDFATRVHREFETTLKSARVWGTGVFDGQTVGRDHPLHDKDVVELHS